jgi:hypothetical protein
MLSKIKEIFALNNERVSAGVGFLIWVILVEIISMFSEIKYDWLSHFGTHLSVLGTIVGLLNFRTLEKMKVRYSGNKHRITILSEINLLLEKLINSKTDDKTKKQYLSVKSKLKIIDEIKNDQKIHENVLLLPDELNDDSIYDITAYMTQIGTLLESASYIGD